MHKISNLSQRPPARSWRRVPVAALALVAGCEAKLTVDLTDAPVDSASEVALALTGVSLLTEANAVVSLPLDATQVVDLLKYQGDDTYRLASKVPVENARYVGIALDFAADGSYARRDDGAVVPIGTPAARTFSPIDLSVGENDEESLVVDLNLRFSLIDDSSTTGTYRLQPVLRAVRLEDSASVGGIVGASIVESDSCRNGRATTVGVAVYAYSGANITPVDYVGQSNLLDAANVTLDTSTGLYAYSLHFLPAGTYTLALTCEADADTPTAQDGLSFRAAGNIVIDAGETGELHFL